MTSRFVARSQVLSAQSVAPAEAAMWRAMIRPTACGSRVWATSRERAMAAPSSVAVSFSCPLAFHRKMWKIA